MTDVPTDPTSTSRCLVLRLAGPLQSWGAASEFNRRATEGEPTKSGIIGLLAAAQGLRRQEPLDDLLGLSLGVRTDQPGTLLRDYHTVSDLRGRPLLSAQVNAKGVQKPTSPPKHTHLTQRYYLQDAVFLAAVAGPLGLITILANAIRRPAYPLALGRRSCPPTQPMLIRDPQAKDNTDLWNGSPLEVLQRAPWQGNATAARVTTAVINLPITVDDSNGDDLRHDVPGSFDPYNRSFTTRRVRHDWAHDIVTGVQPRTGDSHSHDPFALLGW